MRLCVVLALAALLAGTPVRPALAEPVTSGPVLVVPFLPQTEALCGGAAVAMVFRFWGDRHADVQQFAGLVDRRAGGIADTVLVRAVEERGWRTERLDGTLATLSAAVEGGRPPIVLIEDRPGRFHFVVVVAADSARIVVHDPAWGPSRQYEVSAFLKSWKASGFWTVLVTPGQDLAARSGHAEPHRAPGPGTACDRAMDEAIGAVQARGLDSADAILGAVQTECPFSSRPISELAGVRFAQRRFAEAGVLASRAVALDASDEYGWDVLGSSRFVLDDVDGAIQAWNATRRPRLDSVAIEGLHRTRYARLAMSLPLESNRVLTARAFSLTGRRLEDHPGFVGSRVDLAPGDDGWAVARIAVVERPTAPAGWMGWSLAAATTAVNREVRVDVPGSTGQGELWSARWRWWQHRPAVGFAFSAPMTGRIAGVWTVEASWMAQSYAVEPAAAAARESRAHGGITRSDWAMPNLRYELSAGLDVWNGAANDGRRAVTAGGLVERRFARDRVAATASARHWWGLNHSENFGALDVRLSGRSSARDRGFVASATVGSALVSTRAPLSEWAGAGDIDPRSPLLRAHPLTRAGVVDSQAFGERLAFASFEQRHWLEQPALLRLGVAAFVDAARAWRRPDGSTSGPLVVDAGVGLRIRWPGQRALLRVDYGRGLRDAANALTIGWQR